MCLATTPELGMSGLKGLRANRMPHRWLAQDGVTGVVGLPTPVTPSDVELSALTPATYLEPPTVTESSFVDIRCHFDALPIKTQSLDLVVMPHTLDLARNPHDTLREVDRVLVPDGRIVISGFNSASLWGAAQRAGHLRQRLGSDTATFMPPLHPARQGGPHHSDFIGYRRLRDWLRLLSIDIEGGRFGCYVPPVQSDVWLRRTGWMEKTGDRWWPVFGAVYFIVAVKRVRGMRMVGLAKRDPTKLVKAPPWWHSKCRLRHTPRPVLRQLCDHHRMTLTATQPTVNPAKLESTHVVIYADGACKGNPGPGGWGAWLRQGDA